MAQNVSASLLTWHAQRLYVECEGGRCNVREEASAGIPKNLLLN